MPAAASCAPARTACKWQRLARPYVRVSAGDFIVGDEDGIVVVPKDRATEVFERALALRAAEQRILEATLSGLSLTEARRQAAYHTLQRAES